MNAAVQPLPQTASRLWAEPRALNLVEMIQMPARRYPDLPALGLWSPHSPAQPVSWRELWEGACSQATQLRNAGLTPRARVLLVLPTCRAFFECFFGVLLAGAIPVPAVPPGSPRAAKRQAYAEHIAALAKNSRAEALFAARESALQLGAAAGPCVAVFSPAAGPAPEFVAPVPSPDDTALIQYTSGSTSHPKGVELTHGNLLANAEAITRAFIEPDTVGVSWLPLFHDMGLIGAFLTGLYCRRPVVFMPPQAFVKDPAAWLRCISDCRATATVAPNFAFAWCVRNLSVDDLVGVRLDSLRVALNGAEPVDTAALDSFQEAFAPIGLRAGVVRPVYGLAESSLAVTFSDPGGYRCDVVDADRLEQARRAEPARSGHRTYRFVSVGRAIFSQQVRVVGRRGQPLAERRVGEVLVCGPSVMKGYFRRPVETAAALRGGWLHTGDLGYIAAGELYLVGRRKDLIIRHGRNYLPHDIELRVTRLDGVVKGGAAAFSVRTPGETPAVVVITETRIRDAQDLERLAGEVRRSCQDAFLFGPDDVCFVPPGAIPRSSSGKVKRGECRRLYQNSSFEPLRRTPASQVLATMWREQNGDCEKADDTTGKT